MAFPKRFVRARVPNYDEAIFRVLANPDGALYTTLLTGDTSTPENTAKLGAALQEAYGGDVVEAYGITFDFSTAEKAIATIQNDAVPVDLRTWLRNAPLDIVTYEREEVAKNFRASLIPGP